MKKIAALLLSLAFAPLASAASSDVDLHDYWDQRCQGCHGHSSEFARRFLRVEKGRLVGVHHRDDLDVFLRNHYLTDSLVAPVSAMLSAQVTTPPLFAQKCSGCHGTAAEFARKSLAISGGVLVSASSGRKVADTLAAHGGLGPRDVPLVVGSLTRVRNEVSYSAK